MESWSKNISFELLRGKFGSPLYVFNPQQLKENVVEFCQFVGKAENIYYPVKANSAYVLLKQLHKLGCSVDCASVQEVETVLYAGFDYDQIIYNSPAPDYKLIQTLLSKGAKVVADSVNILNILSQEIRPESISGELFVRINPEIAMEYLESQPWQEMTQHASDSSKFGIPSELVIDILADYEIPISGLHIHVGTQMDNLDVFSSALTMLHRLRNEIKIRTKHDIKTINLGGGLGIDFTESGQYPTIADYRNMLVDRLDDEITYIVEPGQALVGNTCGLLTTVKETKQIRNKKWAIVDVGSNELIKVSLLNWPHCIVDKDHNELPFEGNDAIGGPLCFAGDVLLPNTCLDSVDRGDVLFIQHTGAYCSAVSNNFNGFLKPALVIVDQQGHGQIVEEQEEHFISPAILSNKPLENPLHRYSNHGEESILSLELIQNLSSTYLSTGANEDYFNIVSVKYIGCNTLSFDIDVKSSLGVLSMPLATRIMAETVIISAFYLMKRTVKDRSVWGSRFLLNSNKIIKVNKVVNFQIYISPTITEGVANSNSHLAYVSVADGRFSGVFKFSL